MRVLRLDVPGGPMDFHPYVTVVRGLPPATREAILGALAGAARGAALTGGLVEAHGVLFDLDDATMTMLELRSDLDVVVHAGDLPGAGGGGARIAEAKRALDDAEGDAAIAEAVLDRAERALEGAREALDAARAGVDAGPSDGLAGPRSDLEQRRLDRAEAERILEEAAAAERAAARAVLDADTAADAARAVRAEATRALSVAAAALEAAADRRDPMALAALDAARARLLEAEEAVVAARAEEDRGDRPVPVVPPTEEEVAALRAQRVDAEAALLALDTADPSPVRLALEQLRSGAPDEPVPDPRALELADRWAELEAEIDAASAADDVDDDHEGGDERAAARARLVAAEAVLAAAEAAARTPPPDADDVRALEAAHLAVQEARDALDRRFRKGSPARVAAAEAAEIEVLDRLGFATYTDFVLGQPKDADAQAGQRLEAARSEMMAAVTAARRLDIAVAGELRRAELLDRRRELRALAVELLGDDPGDDDLAGELRRFRVPVSETGGHLARLRSALEATGLVLGDEHLPERTLADLASVWLEEEERASIERATLAERVSELDARLAEAKRLRDLAAADPATSRPSPVVAAMAAVDEAREAVAVAEARLQRHDETEAEVEERRLAFEEVAGREVDAVAALAAAEAAATDARAVERDVAADARGAESHLATAREAEAAAAELLSALESRLAQGVDTVEALEADVARATTEVARARADAAQRLADVDAAREALVAAEQVPDDLDPVADAEDAEWFLLARLAGQRAVSFAGSVPLVLDDALAGYGVEPTRRLLDRLERMAATVQVVVVTEDLTTAAWAESLGVERAAVVER